MSSASQIKPAAEFLTNILHGTGQKIAETFFALTQNSRLFKPYGNHVRKMLPPDAYEELAGHGVTERIIRTGKHSTMGVWEKPAKEGMPTVVFFNGRTGHFGDTGKLRKNKVASGYDRGAFLKLMRNCIDEGYGIVGFIPEGFGNTKGRPSQKAIVRSVEAFAADWFGRSEDVPLTEKEVARLSSQLVSGNAKKPDSGGKMFSATEVRAFRHNAARIAKAFEPERPSGSKMIFLGSSMGCSVAARLAKEFDRRGDPVALVAMCNPFSSMAEAVVDVVKGNKLLQALGVSFAADQLEKSNWLLRHKLRTREWISKLSKITSVLVMTSEKDDFVLPAQSDKVMDEAVSRLWHATHVLFEGRGHLNPPLDVITEETKIAYAGNKALMRESAGDAEMLAERMASLPNADGVYMRPRKLFATEVVNGKGQVTQVNPYR